ncbi:hypothetical protein PFLUV_G00112550 [Perca fluviatilis]|uniref:Uncharacterized protein n=1 Tax=Perca fluviatilis TaxID=8168 RepID=A0A6A5E9S5_PERFL|nr:hypothetical protein PFLUV_G00112550 [Perca fluviatilis]
MAWLFSARDLQVALRVTTAAEIFFRYSKWHRLNQEVEKTTKKNKLDKIPYFCYFDASLLLKSAGVPVVWIENKKHIDGHGKRLPLLEVLSQTQPTCVRRSEGA